MGGTPQLHQLLLPLPSPREQRLVIVLQATQGHLFLDVANIHSIYLKTSIGLDFK